MRHEAQGPPPRLPRCATMQGAHQPCLCHPWQGTSLWTASATQVDLLCWMLQASCVPRHAVTTTWPLRQEPCWTQVWPGNFAQCQVQVLVVIISLPHHADFACPVIIRDRSSRAAGLGAQPGQPGTSFGLPPPMQVTQTSRLGLPGCQEPRPSPLCRCCRLCSATAGGLAAT